MTYNRLSDTGGSSFLCCCDHLDGPHRDYCHAGLLDDLRAAEAQLAQAEGGNAQAEAFDAVEDAMAALAGEQP